MTRPLVTRGLVAVCALVYLLTLLLTPTELSALLATWGATPADLHPVTLITSQFLHVGFFHLLGNLLFLWVFGDNIEDWLGHVGYFFFTLGCGAIALLAHSATTAWPELPVVGASGAVSAIMGAYLVLLPHNRVTCWIVLWVFVKRFELRALWMISLYFAVDLVIELLGRDDGIAHGAHLGGLAAGAALAWGLRLLAFHRQQRAELADGRAIEEPSSRLDDGETRLDACLACKGADELAVETILLATSSQGIRGVPHQLVLELCTRLTDAGHETLAGVVLERMLGELAAGRAPASVESEVHARLAALYSGPLVDVARARRHALAAGEAADDDPRVVGALRNSTALPVLPAAQSVTLIALEPTRGSRPEVELALARSLGWSQTQAARALVEGMGILASGIAPARAEQALSELEHVGLACSALDDLEVPRTPPALLVESARFTPDGVSLEIAGADDECRSWHWRWPEIEMALAAFVEEDSMPSLTLRPSIPESGTPLQRERVGIGLSPQMAAGQRRQLRVAARLEIHPRDLEHGFVLDERSSRVEVADPLPALPLQQAARALLGHDELLYISSGIVALAGLGAVEPHIAADVDQLARYRSYCWIRHRLARRRAEELEPRGIARE